MAKGIVFRGRHSSDLSLIVNKVHRSLLPPLSDKTITIPNRPGGYFFGNEQGVRLFKVDFTVSTHSVDDLWTKIHELNSWLQSDEEEELIFDQEPYISYFAVVVGTTDLESIGSSGMFSVTFLCPDPFGYGPEVDTPLWTTSPKTLNVGGAQQTYPVIKATFTAPSTFLAVATKEEFIHIGRSPIDTTVVPVNAKVINDTMSSTAAWTPHTLVDGGSVSGTFHSNGYSFQAQDYGTGSAWHGPALKKMIATPIQDFMLDAIVGLSANGQKQIGRVEIYLLDVNSAVIGKLAIRDSGGYERSFVEARAGGNSGGHYFMNYEGVYSTQKKKVAVTKKVKGKNVTTYTYVTEQYGTFRDFMGLLRIRRTGNKWYAYVEKRDPKTGKAIVTKSFSFIDSGNKYSQKIAGVAVHVGQYATHPFMSPTYISHLTLTNLKTVSTGETLEIFDAGDEVIIDHEIGAVFLNGTPYMEDLDIASDFFPIQGGTSQEISFEPDDKCNIIVSHRPRYL
jgi:predicted phage tail component-like protein